MLILYTETEDGIDRRRKNCVRRTVRIVYITEFHVLLPSFQCYLIY